MKACQQSDFKQYTSEELQMKTHSIKAKSNIKIPLSYVKTKLKKHAGIFSLCNILGISGTLWKGIFQQIGPVPCF